jgi:antitoxin MazE
MIYKVYYFQEVLSMNKMATVSNWGNAKGVRLPELYCRQLGITAGDKVSVSIDDSRIIIKPNKNTLSALLATWDGKGSPEGEFDFGKPVGKEMW